MKYIYVSLLSAVAILSGCAFKTIPYGASSQNVEIIKSQNINPVAVSPFTSYKPGLASLSCRGTGTVAVTPNFENYIENALIDELKLAGAYDPASNVTITGKLEEIEVSSAMDGGNWTLLVTITNGKNQSFTTKSIFTFPGSYIGSKACAEVAQHFTQAVQQLIKQIVQNPEFKKTTM